MFACISGGGEVLLMPVPTNANIVSVVLCIYFSMLTTNKYMRL